MERYGITDKGLVRLQNQDKIYLSNDEKYNLYIIADGMGGANAGDIASKEAITYAKNYILDNYIDSSDNEIKNLIQQTIEKTNTKIYEMSIQNKDYDGMGTTIIILLIIGHKMYIGHVGDSALYRIRRNVIRKVTKDHTYVQKLIDDKTITKQQALTHPKRHMITKVVGCYDNIEPDIIVKKLEENDYILLCTDGLYNLVKEKEIYEVITKNDNSKQSCNELVQLAKDRGGYDNISAILIKYN